MHLHACLVLIYFVSQKRGKQANVVSERCSEKFHKIIQKTLTIDCFSVNLQTYNLEMSKLYFFKKTLWPLFMDGVQLPQG